MPQDALFADPTWNGLRRYGSVLTASLNHKGVMDIDTVKGCTLGMQAYPDGGCYGECYARKIAARRGFDFAVSVSRRFCDREDMATIRRMLNDHAATWYRVGTHGDPCHDWDNTIRACKSLWPCGKTPVIVTKHWIALADEQIEHMRRLKLGVVFNTSVSGMDTDAEIAHRVGQMQRLAECGVRSVLRVVTCKYGTSEWARARKERQDYLLSFDDVIDNPFRAPKSNARVLSGDILLSRNDDSVGGGKFVSLHCSSA